MPPLHDGLEETSDQTLTAQLTSSSRVVPMGRSWAVWFIQNAMERVLDDAVGGVKIRQRGPSPPLQLGAAQSLLEAQVL